MRAWRLSIAAAVAVAMVFAILGGQRVAADRALPPAGPVTGVLLPDLDQEAPAELEVTRMRGRVRLGFRSAARNVGAGPLVIEGSRSSRLDRTMEADQVLTGEAGRTSRRPSVGRLRYVRSPDHEHWHMLGFERYELRRAGRTGAPLRDRKSGFCLGDRYRAAGEPNAAAPDPVFESRCGLGQRRLLALRQGISVGWGDDYAATLEGQFIDVTGLRSGRYVLVHRVNADRRLLESTYDNNDASLLVRLSRRGAETTVTVLQRCPASERCGS